MKNVVKIPLLTALLICASAPILKAPGGIPGKSLPAIYVESFTLNTLTVYNPTRTQCDSDPLITASNKRIDTEKLRKGSLRWMALSRDLLMRWGGTLHYGDTISLDAGDASIDGLWIIQDTMNKRFSNRGDLLFHSAARSTGRWSNVKITRRKVLMING